jgi:hypothetical protein
VSGGSQDETVRAARNQALHREVNERIKDLNERLDDPLDGSTVWVCECNDLDCTEPLQLTLGEYEQLRAHPNHFAVLPGHVEDAVERIVEEHETYLVVAKLGRGAVFAVENDPREPEPTR